MEYLAGLYTLLLVAICLELAVVLWRTGKKQGSAPDHDELKRWMQQQLDAQAKEFAARQSALAEQNHTALRSVSETLQTAVQNMSTTLAQGQDSQQQLLERRLRSLEASNTQKLEELRRSMAESMTALQAENNRKLDEIRHTVDEQLQDTLQKRVSESFKAVNEQLEQVYKGLGEMQNLAADVGGLKQVLSGVKTRGILGEIQLGAILEEILAPEQYDTNVATIPGSTQRVEYAIRMPGADGLQLLKAAKAKKHILCEKPAAMNVAQFDQMMHAVRENNVMFSVHQQRRFDKDFAIAKRVFDEGMVGKPYVIKSQLYGANGYMHDWHVYKKYGGGMMYEWGVHLIDQMLYMVPGKIRTVYADIRNVINEEVDDYFRIELLFESGISAEIELGTYYLTPKRGWFIGGDTGNLIVDGFGGSEGQIVRTTHLLENVPGKITMTAAGPTRSFSPNQKDVLYTEPMPEVHVNHLMYFENFLNAMNGAEPFLVTPAQVRRVLMVMDAARESAAVGRSIHFLERETKI